jgi:hypothetical protein
MPEQTQPKVGHLKGTSTNDTARSGRSSGNDGGQKKVGYPKTSSPPVPRNKGGVPSYVPGEDLGQQKVKDRSISTERTDLVDRSPNIEGP